MREVGIHAKDKGEKPSNLSDVWRTQRLVAWSAVKREVGIHAEGEGENLNSGSGVWRKTPRLVVRLFGWFLVHEESKINGHGGNSGDQMKVPSVVA
jgi:hypothetical protein